MKFMTASRYTLIGKVIAFIVLACAAIPGMLSALTFRTITVTETNPLSATLSTLTPGAASITANGSSTQVLTVTERGPQGIRQSSGGAAVTITKQSGTGSIRAVTDNHNGTYTATVTAPTATGSGSFVATLNGAEVKSGTGTQTQATVTYVAGAATQIAVNGGDAQSAKVGTAVTTAPSVIVKDANNNPVSGVSVTFANGTGGSVSGTLTATTGINGIALFEGTWTLNTVDSNTLTATSGTLGGSPVTFTASGTVAIGDSYGGGIVAYILQSGDLGYVAGETHGLIAATADQSTATIPWALDQNYFSSVPGGTSAAIGTGSANTDNIIDQNGSGQDYAAGLARAYNGGGYSDWYLPSKDELNQLYINRSAVGVFSGHDYWSSTEKIFDLAWNQSFFYGNNYPEHKQNTCSVRAVRAF